MSAPRAQPAPNAAARRGRRGTKALPHGCPFNMEEPGQNYRSQRPALPALPGLRAQRRTPGAVVPPQPRLCGQGTWEGAARRQNHPKIVSGCWRARGRRSAAGARCPLPVCGSGAGGDPRCWGLGVLSLGGSGCSGCGVHRLGVPRLGGSGVHKLGGLRRGALGVPSLGGSRVHRLGGLGVHRLGGLGCPGRGCRGFRVPSLGGSGCPYLEELGVHKLGVPKPGGLGVHRLGGLWLGGLGCPGSGVRSAQDARTRGQIRVPRVGGAQRAPVAVAAAARGGTRGCARTPGRGRGRAGRALRADPRLGSGAGSWQSRGSSRSVPSRSNPIPPRPFPGPSRSLPPRPGGAGAASPSRGAARPRPRRAAMLSE